MAVKEIRESDGKRDKGEYWHWGFDSLFLFRDNARLASRVFCPLIAGGSDPVVLVQPYEAVVPYIRPSFWVLDLALFENRTDEVVFIGDQRMSLCSTGERRLIFQLMMN
ncbi:hypothetical protein V6N13_009549 [Hibiscus sabdariffa]|uniref:Uncharacterized protein n=2 Tax=Hibiscus sabdariffa TaxID=183260 RepID=A0ABR2A863_9ROSI